MAMTQCLSKRYLNHDILDNDNLGILGYELISVDQPSSKNPGRICIYHKGLPQIKVKHVSYLKVYLNFELSVHGKLCNIKLIYRSPNQSPDAFHTCLTNFELLLGNSANRNPFVSIIIGNFNAR